MASFKITGFNAASITKKLERAQVRALNKGMNHIQELWAASLRNETGKTRRQFVLTVTPRRGTLALVSWGGVVSETGARPHPIDPVHKKALSWIPKPGQYRQANSIYHRPIERRGYTRTSKTGVRHEVSGSTIYKKEERYLTLHVEHPGVQTKHLLLQAGFKGLPYLKAFLDDELARIATP